MKKRTEAEGQPSPAKHSTPHSEDENQSEFCGQEWPAYVKCSTCGYEGQELRQRDKTSVYDADCPQCGNRTLFLYFIFPVGGG